MEDPKKIKSQIDELNKNYPPAKWDAVEGFHSSYAVVISPNGGQDVNTNRGITLKYFVNSDTNEIKVFYYKKFTKTIKITLKKA